MALTLTNLIIRRAFWHAICAPLVSLEIFVTQGIFCYGSGRGAYIIGS